MKACVSREDAARPNFILAFSKERGGSCDGRKFLLECVDRGKRSKLPKTESQQTTNVLKNQHAKL